VLDSLLKLASNSLTVVSDGHPDYTRSLSRHPNKQRIRVHAHPNPKRGPKGSRRSPEAIARDAAMYPVDLLHMILRHTLAHHRRETIAFTRRLNAAMERLALTATIAFTRRLNAAMERLALTAISRNF